MVQRRRLSISSLSSVAFGCVKLGVGVTVAAGAVAYAAVQVYRGPAAHDDRQENEQTCQDTDTKAMDNAPSTETTQPHALDTSTDAAHDSETSSHANEPNTSTAEPHARTPPDSPLPETPIDMTHHGRDEEKTPPRTHKRKVSFAPIPETEEAIFVPALAPQEPAVVPQQQQQQQDPAHKTTSAAKKKKKNQKKKKTHAQAGSEIQDQNARITA
ncbi:hypothetical protein AURDEDRAFT_127770 [Auricularia subglabra TFB-10046 SS5]|nr:hypothetical protein AURDEDRAFT_127770 [Auricularia subglabra TFB-10046 SS5]